MITNPIPSSQIVDINVTFGDCMEEPECITLDDTLQVFSDKINELCDRKEVDLASFDFGDCLTPTLDPVELLQDIANRVDCTPSAEDLDISGLNYCDADSWTCATISDCLIPVDEIGNVVLVPTIKEAFQMLIKRVISLEAITCAQATTITAMQVVIDTHEARLDEIEDNCCNVTLDNQINGVGGIEDRLATVETTCCP